MKKIFFTATVASLLLSGCLYRTSYYPPTGETISTDEKGCKRGAIQEQGYYPWWSDAPGKNFLNPSFSVVGKEVKE